MHTLYLIQAHRKIIPDVIIKEKENTIFIIDEVRKKEKCREGQLIEQHVTF